MADTALNASLSLIQEKVSAGQFASALDDLRPLLDSATSTEALYMSAVCYRYLKRYEEAQRALSALKSRAGDRGRAYQEQGHLDLARNRPQQALAAFANATQLNPALVASWQNQARILTILQRPEDAQQADAQVRRLQALAKPLLAVMDLLAQGKLGKAEALCRKFLRAHPTDVEAMRLLAGIAVQFGVLEDAEYLLESASEFDGANTQLKVDLVDVLRKRQKFSEAQALAESLYRRSPDNVQLKSLFAIEEMQMGRYDHAVTLFDEILEVMPNDPITLTSKGHALKTLGHQQPAIASYRAAVRSDPWYGEAYYAMSNLKTYRFDDDELSAMQAYEVREEISPMGAVHFCFALGKAFEDRKDFHESFRYYRKGNALKRELSNYDPDQMSEDLKAQRNYFVSDVFQGRTGAGTLSRDPIFIVGLPRAGSTLLEQILSSHSAVDGTLELPNILSMAQKLRRRGREGAEPYPALLSELKDDELAGLGEQYISDTRIHRKGAPYFIDKMPNNFRHIGLIKLILPNAKIIDARRDPMACCFSGFKQLFAEGQEFTYDLTDLGCYYRDYLMLMDHWDTVIPGEVLRVDYEDVVDDLEKEVRRLLDFCGLPFEEACLNFHQTKRAVRTASSEQVRRPIYSEGLEQWVNYEAFLEPLRKALASEIEP
ncbi:MAG: sulfotransferase [Pseudomonadota bacterium]